MLSKPQHRDRHSARTLDRESRLPPLQPARPAHLVSPPRETQSQPRTPHTPIDNPAHRSHRHRVSIPSQPRALKPDQYQRP